MKLLRHHRYKRCFSLAETNIDMVFRTSLLLFHLAWLDLDSVYIVLGGT